MVAKSVAEQGISRVADGTKSAVRQLVSKGRGLAIGEGDRSCAGRSGAQKYAEGMTDTVVEDFNAATIALEFRGQVFEVPKRRGRWPVEAVLQFGRGNRMQAINAMLGGKEWSRLVAVAPTADDFNEFADQAVTQLNAESVL